MASPEKHKSFERPEHSTTALVTWLPVRMVVLHALGVVPDQLSTTIISNGMLIVTNPITILLTTDDAFTAD